MSLSPGILGMYIRTLGNVGVWGPSLLLRGCFVAHVDWQSIFNCTDGQVPVGTDKLEK